MPAGTKQSEAHSILSVATHCKPGTRFPSQQVLSQSDARPWQLHHKMPSDGRFRLVVLGGDISTSRPQQRERVNRLGAWLRETLLPRFARMALSVGADPHGGTMQFRAEREPSVIDVLLIHCASREDVEMVQDLDEAYHPFDSRLGWEYDKVFVDGPSYHEGDGEAYKKWGVDRERGAVVAVRPDGYVGLVTSLEDEGWTQLETWFRGILRFV